MAGLTKEQLSELEDFCRNHANTGLIAQLLREHSAQAKALASLRQYVEMFNDAEGQLVDVDDLVSDLREVLDGVQDNRKHTLLPLSGMGPKSTKATGSAERAWGCQARRDS